MDHTSVTDELHAWVRLSLEPGLGPVKARELLATIGLPPAIYASSLASLERLIPSPLARQLTQAPKPETLELIEKTLAWAKQPGHHIVTLADSGYPAALRSEEHTSELQSRGHLVCRLLLEKKKDDGSRGRVVASQTAPPRDAQRRSTAEGAGSARTAGPAGQPRAREAARVPASSGPAPHAR